MPKPRGSNAQGRITLDINTAAGIVSMKWIKRLDRTA
jgi:hypothetical protein